MRACHVCTIRTIKITYEHQNNGHERITSGIEAKFFLVLNGHAIVYLSGIVVACLGCLKGSVSPLTSSEPAAMAGTSAARGSVKGFTVIYLALLNHSRGELYTSAKVS
jgi:hypothetical protein